MVLLGVERRERRNESALTFDVPRGKRGSWVVPSSFGRFNWHAMEVEFHVNKETRTEWTGEWFC